MLSGFLSLLAVQKSYLFFGFCFFVGREIVVMAIRYFALQKQYRVSVSFWGKAKTASQIALVALVIMNPSQSLGLFQSWWNIIEKYCCYLLYFFLCIQFQNIIKLCIKILLQRFLTNRGIYEIFSTSRGFSIY